MFNLKSVVTIATLSVLTLTACGEATKTAQDAVQKGADVVKDAESVTNLANKAKEIPAMTTGIQTTIDAVKSGKFDEAKDAFGKVQSSWSALSETIKSESAETYSTINEKVEAVKTDLNAEKPDATKITDTLTSITTALGNIKSEEKVEG